MNAAPGANGLRRIDLVVTLVSLLLLLTWDASGADLAVMRSIGSVDGFAWREHWFTRALLHQGGRALAWFVLLLLIVDALRPVLAGSPGGPSRAIRARWIGVVLAGVLLVPSIKRLSSTSCPWDLAEFGGIARYVGHWQWGLADGGPGHCFPSGHAVAAFAFFAVYFLWRDHRPYAARWWLAGVLLVGLTFGWAQLVRGAHYPSHTLWSAWLCWSLGVAATAAARRRPAGVLAGAG